MEPGGGDYYKMKNWVDTFMQIPFGKYRNLPITIDDGVEKCHAFMDNAKQVKTELDAILRSNSISTLYIAVSIPRPPPFPFNLLEIRAYAEDD